MVSDTVGFIHRLPHQLVEAFKATLEEVRTADLLLHVVDGSSSTHSEQIEVVEGVLNEIGADNIARIMVFNKADLADSPFTGYIAITRSRSVRYGERESGTWWQ